MLALLGFALTDGGCSTEFKGQSKEEGMWRMLTRALLCVTLSVVAAHMAGLWLNTKIKVESNLEPTLHWVSDSFVYLPGYRGGFPRIKFPRQGLELACPRNSTVLPCDDPKAMRREIGKGIEGFHYRKYKEATLSSGDGLVVGVKYADGSLSINADPKIRFGIIYVAGFLAGFALSLCLCWVLFKRLFASSDGLTGRFRFRH